METIINCDTCKKELARFNGEILNNYECEFICQECDEKDQIDWVKTREEFEKSQDLINNSGFSLYELSKGILFFDELNYTDYKWKLKT